jgi:4-amino-4-deoxy-L-arabinose transferase-like glycosyltransferase
LSYWAILPFVKLGGLTESMLRMPATLAGLGTAMSIFFMGRRLFGARAGFFAAILLLTSPMFLLWGRTASAELLNTLAIWVMLTAILAARSKNRFRNLLLFYCAGAVGSFLKGPVAPAVVLCAILIYGTWGTFDELRRSGFAYRTLKASVFKEFFWLLSGPGIASLLLGAGLFCFLLFLPVLLTGSWTSVLLMWKENVVRFFSPFDHRDPAYSYIGHIMLFCAPWTFLVLASIWQARYWETGNTRRWTLGSALGILLFFLISGSRRGYYILPLIPVLALITGKALDDWVANARASTSRVMDRAALATTALLILLSGSLFYVYLFMPAYRHGSEILVGVIVAIGALLVGILLAVKKNRLNALSVLFLLVFIISLWGFTQGMKIGERERGLRDFARQASKEIDKAGQDAVALYSEGNAILIFYLNRASAIKYVHSIADINSFREKYPKGLLLVDVNEIPSDTRDYFQRLIPLIYQTGSDNQREERFTVMKFPDGGKEEERARR